MRWLAGLLVIGLTVAASVSSAQQTTPRRVALVIANSTYSNASKLPNPPNDAKLVAGALQRAGFQTVELKGDASLATFRQALRDFRAKADRAQVALIYYAGHGIEGNGKNWLIPTDAVLATERDLEYEAVSLDLVLDAVKGADLRIVILDACRNNPFGRSWGVGTRAVTRGLSGIDVDDVLVIYAAAPGQTASDGTGTNSPFATAFAKRVPEAGVPIQLLGGMVRDDVLRETGSAQRPFISASITGTPFYLVEKATTALASQGTATNLCAASDQRWIGGLKTSNDRVALQGFVNSTPGQCISHDAAQLRLAGLARGGGAAASATVERSVAIPSFRDCPECPLMVTVPAGAYTMGSPESIAGSEDNERPEHQVRIASFVAGAYEITFEEWEACVADGGCGAYKPEDHDFGRGKRPVIDISWNDAQLYVAWLKKKTGKDYRLLTEAEWEYAARAGTTSAYYLGPIVGEGQANVHSAFFGTVRVGSYSPNAFGLYDVIGNAWEWVEDCYQETYAGAPVDGAASSSLTGNCSERVLRGGSWTNLLTYARSAYRNSTKPSERGGFRGGHFGFRVARAL